jgi:hypothetical protein
MPRIGGLKDFIKIKTFCSSDLGYRRPGTIHLNYFTVFSRRSWSDFGQCFFFLILFYILHIFTIYKFLEEEGIFGCTKIDLFFINKIKSAWVLF